MDSPEIMTFEEWLKTKREGTEEVKEEIALLVANYRAAGYDENAITRGLVHGLVHAIRDMSSIDDMHYWMGQIFDLFSSLKNGLDEMVTKFAKEDAH